MDEANLKEEEISVASSAVVVVDHAYEQGVIRKRFVKPEEQFKWSDEQTRKFLELRRKHISSFFSGKRGSIQKTYAVILEEMGLTGKVSPSKARKKWNNMAQLYRRLANQPSFDAGDGKELVPAISWPFFRDVEQTLAVEPEQVQIVQEEDCERFGGTTATTLEELSDQINAQMLHVAVPARKKSKKIKRAVLLGIISELQELNAKQEEIQKAKDELTLKFLSHLV